MTGGMRALGFEHGITLLCGVLSAVLGLLHARWVRPFCTPSISVCLDLGLLPFARIHRRCVAEAHAAYTDRTQRCEDTNADNC